MNTIVFSTVQALADAIRRREVSALEVLDAHLVHIARHNADLNAIVTLDEEQVRSRAREADLALARGELWGPLHGVPVTIKDAWETAGLRTTSGYPPLAAYVPEHDATIVGRLRAAGATILGKTNMPPLADGLQTENSIFGRTSNPWDRTRTVGGSTGGGAAAVAAGLSPLELGADIGGSVRVPAHYCGIFGLKTTEHLVPLTGHIPPLPGSGSVVRHMGVAGPMARSVDDLALALRVIAGPDGQDWDVPPVALDAAPDRALRDLRFAWVDEEWSGLAITGETRRALVRLTDELARLGCRVEQCAPQDFGFTAAWETWGEMFQVEVGSSMTPERELEAAAQAKLSAESRMPVVRGMARSVAAGVRQFRQTLRKRDALGNALERFLGTWDALLCPVSVGPAFPHCPVGARIDVDGRKVPYLLAGMGYTSPFNVTANPAVAIPLTRSAEGLPIGIQVVGRRWHDLSLLTAARYLTEVIGPIGRPVGY